MNSLDCDDSDAGINPLGEESCDSVDNDCDGVADEDIERCEEGVIVPPNPEEVATENAATETTNLSDSTEFLYTGDDAIQTGVTEGSISSQQAAILRGQILKEDGTALSGVTVSVMNHSEWGSTLTQSDGEFDLAVNGGGALVLQFEREGYFSIQKTVDAAWQSYTHVGEMMMITQEEATTVDLTTGSGQVATGSEMMDSDGTREQLHFFLTKEQQLWWS